VPNSDLGRQHGGLRKVRKDLRVGGEWRHNMLIRLTVKESVNKLNLILVRMLAK